MKAALSMILAGLVVTTPVKQALAQAEQQESRTSAAQERPVAAPRSSTSSPGRVGVPALEHGSSAALLWTAQAAATAPAGDSLADDLRFRRISTAGKVAIVVVVVGVLVVVGFFLLDCQCTA